MEEKNPPLLVVVTGLPCTGKTALSRRLAADLRLPLIAKDDLKETLFDALGWSDKAWSRRLGLAATRLIYQVAGQMLKAGASVMVESYFHPNLAAADFAALRMSARFRPFVIELTASGEELWRRWQARNATGERHPGHVDSFSDEAEPLLRRGILAPLDLGGPRRVIDTTDFDRLDLAPLVEEIRRELGKG